MKRMLMILTVVTGLFGCSNGNENPTEEGTDSESNPSGDAEVITDELDIPWNIVRHNDVFYIAERPGAVVKVEAGESERQDIDLEETVSTASEAGLLGFVLAPDFDSSNEAYAYYTYENDEGQFNRIVTVEYVDDRWEERTVLLDDIPSGSVHHGGRLEIGPDEKLYATTGDAADPDTAQDMESLGGKILRMNLDGTVPDDNPFDDSLVYSYGHRNPQGLTWLPDDSMYASEHGDNANDEINLIEAGGNYGWPEIEGDETEDGMETPLFTSGSDYTWAPSGMDNDGERLFTAALRGNAVLEFNLEETSPTELVTDYGRVRDVYIEEDELFFITNNLDGRGDGEPDDDKLYRISLTE